MNQPYECQHCHAVIEAHPERLKSAVEYRFLGYVTAVKIKCTNCGTEAVVNVLVPKDKQE